MSKGSTTVFIIGMILDALDGTIYLLEFSIPGIIIHVVALSFMFQGLNAARQFNQLKRN